MIKIISIHIPKTAGRSFYQVLKWAYGEKVGEPMNMDKYVFNDRLDENYIPENMEVIHGHYYFRHVEHLYRKFNARIIFWLREPVERILSNYNYNMLMNREKPWKRHARERINMDLIDFASREKRRNVMHKFLEGLDPGETSLFGFTETFNHDLQSLGKRLGWQLPVPEFRENIGTGSGNHASSKKYDLTDPAIIEKIRELNAADITLYDKLKKLKARQNEAI